MQLAVAPVDTSRRSDFFRVHREAHGTGWCYCVAWWTPTWEGWGARTAEENRALREQLFDRGEYDGYLLYANGEPVGWCQCGPRDRLTKLCQQFRLAPDPAAWAITCFVIASRLREGGLAHHLLAAVLRDLQSRGVGHVQAFPRRGQGMPPEEVWTGPEALFQKAGFKVERDDPRRPVYGKWLKVDQDLTQGKGC
jgi:ribosomal protein S18 acetylase RimI-like enzyme